MSISDTKNSWKDKVKAIGDALEAEISSIPAAHPPTAPTSAVSAQQCDESNQALVSVKNHSQAAPAPSDKNLPLAPPLSEKIPSRSSSANKRGARAVLPPPNLIRGRIRESINTLEQFQAARLSPVPGVVHPIPRSKALGTEFGGPDLIKRPPRRKVTETYSEEPFYGRTILQPLPPSRRIKRKAEQIEH